MSAFRELLRFECRYQLRQPSFVITGLIFFGFAFFATASDGIELAGGSTTHVNGPYSITIIHLVLSVIGMFLAGHFVGNAATRDRSFHIESLILATPVSASQKWWGRLLGAILVCLLVFLAVSVGMLSGSFWPDVAAVQKGPTRMAPYLWAYLVFVIPNFFFCAAMLFALARSTRSLMGMYLGLVAFFALYEVSSHFLDNPATRQLSTLLDPFGFSAFSEATRYWTAEERNTRLVPFEGMLLVNRLIWLGVATVTTLWAQRWHDERKELKVRNTKTAAETKTDEVFTDSATIDPMTRSGSVYQQLLTRTKLEITQVIRTPSFLILSLLTLFILVGSLLAGDSHFGTRSWPLTRMLSETIQSAMSLLILIVLAYYAAESVWREKEHRIVELIDATPTSNAILYLPKLFSLWAVIIGLLAVGIVFAVTFQGINGYWQFEWSVYAVTLSLQYLIPAIMVAVLSVLIQVISPNKYIGMLVFAAYVIANLVLPQLGFEHHLWRYSEGPEAIFSDMNGLGHYLPALLWFHLYWLSLAFVFLMLGLSLWPRGTEPKLVPRLRALSSTLPGKGRLALVAALIAFTISGLYIHHNTMVLNDYRNSEARLDHRAHYEQTLRQYETLPQPAIEEVSLNADFFPNDRRINVTGYYTLVNKTAKPITNLLVSWAENNVVDLADDALAIAKAFPLLNASLVEFSSPLEPGEQRRLTFSVERKNVGFRDGNDDFQVVRNGIFINNQQLLPRLGYDADQELKDPRERRKRALTPPRRMPDLEDESQYGYNYIGKDAQRVKLDVVMSTDKTQIAIAPGQLIKQWQNGQRAFFHYQSEEPILNFFALQSGNYEVRREQHRNIDIEVYYHPKHDMNIDRMIEAAQDALDFMTTSFGPYQHNQLRIIEFPRYVPFAQSFANTIPFSEDIGFVADLRNDEVIDYVYSVTAHEVAHQWWGHQLTPANVQGATVLSESLAQYSAYSLVEARYGPVYLRKYLRWELDQYLRGRTREVIEEKPLMRVEQQPYIHYQKGGLVFYALKHEIGAARLNATLHDLLAEFRFSTDRFPTTEDFLRHLLPRLDESQKAFVHDLFQRITLYDLEIKEATGRQTESGVYEITIDLNIEKFYSDGSGNPVETRFNESLEIGLLAAAPTVSLKDDEVLYVERHALTTGKNTITISADDKPSYVIIDPFIKRIDLDLDNNALEVSWGQ